MPRRRRGGFADAGGLDLSDEEDLFTGTSSSSSSALPGAIEFLPAKLLFLHGLEMGSKFPRRFFS